MTGALPLEHGGRLEAAKRRFASAPLPFVDLSTGINPVPYRWPALAESCFTRLPEPEELERLLGAAADAYAVADPAMVVAAPGTQILISLLPRLFSPRRVAVLAPTYGEHAAAWRAAGHDVCLVTTTEALAKTDIAVLGQPNNPDGRHHPRADLLALADALAARSGVLVVDEAFADLEPAVESLAPALPHAAIVVLRSFGKTYGLAGVRLGFALAAPALADRIATALGPWAVSGIAMAIGRAALADAGWRAARAVALQAAAARLDVVLTGAGLRVVGGTSLFRFCAAGDGMALADALGQRGVLVRSFAELPRRVRVGIPADEMQWSRLGEALDGAGHG